MEERESSYVAFLRERRAELLARIAEAARRAGREPGEIELLAVSKTVGCEELALAVEAGYRVFGENRPQELKRKVSFARAHEDLSSVRFDMIGNLQTNKINQVLGCAELVHSVSSVHLAEAIARRSVARDVVTRCLIEVNVSGEESKSGVSPAEAPRAAQAMCELAGIELVGLMCMAPANDNDTARRSFAGLRELAQDLRKSTGLPLEVLSCGMSGDFEVAVEEGSTLVRLGRIVFDPAFGGQARG